jgi:GTP-binding protein EngB required for normal cell division
MTLADGGARSTEALLHDLSVVAARAGVEGIAREARALAERVGDARFYVACIGQFKRGKSTLVNALIGDRILPTGVVPVTAVPTIVRHGAERSARVQIGTDPWQRIVPEDLGAYVSEEKNPENAKGVVAVEAFVPSPLLASGMCFVDTPGLGSVFAGNSAATRAFVPQIDAVVAVIGADPPIAAEELDLIESVARRVPHVLLVLNKADRVTHDERALATAFAQRVIEERMGRSVGRIFAVSAARALDSPSGPPAWPDWPELVMALERLSLEAGHALAASAGTRGLGRLSGHLISVLDDRRAGLVHPVAETERRVAVLHAILGDAERAIADIASLLAAEEQRLGREVELRRAAFLGDVQPRARAELAVAIAGHRSRWGPSLRRALMRLAQDVARRRLLPWLTQEQSAAAETYRQAMARFIDVGRGFLERTIDDNKQSLAYLLAMLDTAEGLSAPSSFYFQELIRISNPAPSLRDLADIAIVAFGVRRPVEQDALKFLDWLLEVNTSRVQFDLVARLRTSRQRFERHLRRLLSDARDSSQTSLALARQTLLRGDAAVREELAQIAVMRQSVMDLVQPIPSSES